MDHAGDDEEQGFAVGERLVEVGVGGVVFGRARDAEGARASAFDERLEVAAFVAQALDDAEWGKGGEIGEGFDAPTLEGVEDVGSRGKNFDGQRAEDFDFAAGVDDGDAFDVAGGEEGGVRVAGDGEGDFDFVVTGATEEGFGDVGGRADEALEAVGGEEDGALVGLFPVGSELGGEDREGIDGTALQNEAGVHGRGSDGAGAEERGGRGGVDGFAEVDAEVDTAEEGAGPVGSGAGEFQLGDSGLSEKGSGGSDEDDAGGAFDREAETVPPGGGDALKLVGGKVAEVNDEHSEAAAVEDEVGGFQCVLDIVVALDPEDAVEVDAGGFGGGGVKRVGAIDDGAKFASSGGLGEGCMEEGGAAGGAEAGDFSDGAFGEAGEEGAKIGRSKGGGRRNREFPRREVNEFTEWQRHVVSPFLRPWKFHCGGRRRRCQDGSWGLKNPLDSRGKCLVISVKSGYTYSAC